VLELLTEGDSVEDALDNVRDALAAVLELYRDLGKSLSSELAVGKDGEELHLGTRRHPAMRYRDLAKKLSCLGCREVRRTGDGSHRKWLNPANGGLTVVPDWLGRRRLETWDDMCGSQTTWSVEIGRAHV
jgi:predicted RNA binding protein YcfA (HicA-like mRNA interferase family)